MKTNSVTFYVPCLNAARTITACLDSVLGQDYPLGQVMVIDDGSQDQTAEIVSRYPVTLIRHKRNQGLAAARNTAIKKSATDFIASVDADCVCEKDWLRKLMAHFKSSLVAGAGGRLKETYVSTPPDLWRAVHMKQDWEGAALNPPFLFGSNTVFRRAALKKAGFYDTSLGNNYEDVAICSRLKQIGYALAYEPKSVAHHLRQDDFFSVLNNYWRWYLAYYRQENYYLDLERFRFKISENAGTVNRYIEEDILGQRQQLLYLDFILAFHHSLKDLKYFMAHHRQPGGEKGAVSPLSLWLALIDLVFFYHFDKERPAYSTFLGPAFALEENALALVLILGQYLRDVFPSEDFQKILFQHLLLVFFEIDDVALSDKIIDVVRQHPDWSGFIKKDHPALCKEFLEEFCSGFRKYLDGLAFHFPHLIESIEDSARVVRDGMSQKL